MEFRKAVFVGVAAAVVLLCIIECTSGQTGVCYRRRSRRSGYTAYRRAYYSYSYRCGWWGWRRCRRYVSYRQRYTAYRTTYYSQFGCCSGYRQSGSRCYPVCSPSCRNGGRCTAPNRCNCPATWTGSYCQTDVNECARNTDNCQQVCVNTNGGYRCACNTGYSLNSDGRTCRDNNECASNGGRGPCAHNCRNTPGSFVCSCRTGYSLASDRRSCNDINECTNGQEQCAQNCQNTPGSYTCSCRTGYRLGSDGRSCSDINECTEGTHQCAHNCQNTVGSYTCSCRTGYRLSSNGRSCYDINECAEGIDQCAQNCHNTDGSYTCSCNTGYSLDSNGRGCSDIDECALNTDGCAQNCQNTVGSYTCSCNAGYRLNADRHRCDDINECVEGTDRCAQNCHNNMGSYTCSCNIGFRLNANGYGCDDIDECTEGTDRCDQNCHNNVGSYTCSCNTGYRLNANGYGCDDIDECTEGTDRCSQNCHNTVGSYTCSCNTGYRLNADRVTCDDIDECAEGTDRCAQNCHNTVGSYTCSCNAGYRLNVNGYGCDDVDECAEGLDECQQICNNTIGSYVCDCRIGYALNSDGRTCRDIDECALGIDRCDQNCHNNIGSYTCSCNAGWRLDFDGFRCNDIDECLPGAIGNTTCHQVCVNTPGSYHCACFLGWRLTANRITCEDINECTDSELMHQCDHTCINNIGSYACTCNSGYTLNVDERTCDDIDECVNNNDLCAQACINTPGSYVCNCTPGYVLDPDGFSCIDVDECSLMTHLCEQNCMNTPGSFTCFCNQTYTKTNDGLSCLGAPEDLLLSVINSRTMEIGWSTPRNDSRDGFFESFQVLCVNRSQVIIYTNILHDRFASTDRVENVMPYTAYNCCVLMITSEGSSPYACAGATTSQDEPDTPPNSISIYQDSPFNLTVTWSTPLLPNGVITRYTLYVDYKNGTITGLPFDSSVTDYIITGLSPYQLVGVFLSASTNVGMGPNSTIANVRTEQTAPSEISQPTSSVTDQNNVVITWDTPENENGVLLYYQVNLYNQLRNYSEIVRLMPDALKSVSFDDLEPEVPYTIEIVAATEAGVSEPFVQTIFTREGVPKVPNITALARLSGTRAILTWQPYTLDTSKGFLTKLEVAYQTVPVTSTRCPSSLDQSAKIIRVEVNESRYTFTELLAEEEYCVSVRASTATGPSPYSEAQRLPLSQATLFQVRFQLPSGIFCNSYIARNMTQKIADIETAIADYVLANCNCEIFSDQYITQGILMCGSNQKEFIFQAKVLSTAEKTSDRFRDELLQKWVNEKPIVKIEKISYQVDPYCTVELTDLRSTYCRSENPTVALSQNNGTKTSLQLAIEVTAGVGGGVFALILIACIVGVACCCCSRKSVKRKYHEPHREGLDIQDPSANRNVTVSPFVPEQRSAFLVGAQRNVAPGTLSRGTLQRGSRVVDEYQPSYEPNESTLQRMARKEKEAEVDEDAPVNPTYIDDDFDEEFDDY